MTDEINNCKVHDLIHELSITKSKEEMGFDILKEEGNNFQPSDKPRHALYHSGATTVETNISALFSSTEMLRLACPRRGKLLSSLGYSTWKAVNQ